MSSLRAKIAALLVAAIVSVVVLAAAATVSVVGAPGPERTIEQAARQIALIAQLTTELTETAGRAGEAGPPLLDRPVAGEPEELTDVLRTALGRVGTPIPVLVTRPAPGEGLVVSVPIGEKAWIAVPFPDVRSPREGWMILAAFMLLIVLGATGVALFVAAKTTRPLTMLENAIAAVDPDGTLPELPENGPGEVRVTAAALNRLSRRLKSAMASRMRLVAAAGHDLRTPMTRMRLRAEFLPEEERGQWLADLDELDKLADSAIRLVREEAERGRAEPLELDRLLRRLVEELGALDFAVSAASIAPARVQGERLGLERAFRNLLINAATHGGRAEIGLAVGAGRAVVTIGDHGPGIPEEALTRVFEPFFRVDPARRQTIPGAGLGLAIAKEIIDRHGGSLTIRNRPAGGLEQTVSLALAP